MEALKAVVSLVACAQFLLHFIQNFRAGHAPLVFGDVDVGV